MNRGAASPCSMADEMTLAEPRPMTVQDLKSRGISCLDDAAVTAHERTTGGVVMISVESAASLDVALATGSARPDHAVVAFARSKDLRRASLNAPWHQHETRNDLLIAPADVPVRLRLHGRWQLIAVLVPRDLITPIATPLPGRAQHYSDRRPLDRAMQQFIEVLLNGQSSLSSIEEYAVEQVVIEMSGAVILDRLSSVERASPDDLLRVRALNLITQECGDPDFSPSGLARELGYSLRRVQAVFATVDSSIAREIRRQRSRLARTLLSDPRYDHISVEQIGTLSGFRVPMSLRRALVDEYGSTPSSLRRGRVRRVPSHHTPR